VHRKAIWFWNGETITPAPELNNELEIPRSAHAIDREFTDSEICLGKLEIYKMRSYEEEIGSDGEKSLSGQDRQAVVKGNNMASGSGNRASMRSSTKARKVGQTMQAIREATPDLPPFNEDMQASGPPTTSSEAVDDISGVAEQESDRRPHSSGKSYIF
jgi:hypothetical protein